jgi:hypothetical protein
MDYLKQLKDLRSKLANEQMSLLVGSGFSRNVSAKFLTWDDLLVDLAFELYEEEIITAFVHYAASNKPDLLTEKDFANNRCRQILHAKGYLEIVSEYIRRKGYPESIATYIEERTPEVFKDGRDFVLACGEVKEQLLRERLFLHKEAIALPWNNIYTTNYDDLLDVCVNEDYYKTLSSEIEVLEAEILEMLPGIQKLEQEKEEISSQMWPPETDTNDLPLQTMASDSTKTDPEAQAKLFQLSYKLQTIKTQKQQKEKILREKELDLNNCYQVVKSATALRLKKKKNIIKLHGSLRSSKQRADFSFEFDGDHKKQYVIAKEDYDSYPTKHEAFTQLMRISLLQESFCLIGFSGVDPNFLQWIGWVRDILHKEALNAEGKKTYKIYLIESGDNEITPDKMLFYENHNIVRIPLRSPEVQKVLQNDLGNKLTIYDHWSALEAFLNFLGNDDHIKPDIPTADTTLLTERNQLWDSLKVNGYEDLPTEASIRMVLNRLKIIQRKIWLPDLNAGYTNAQHTALGAINYEKWRDELPKRPLLLQLVILAVNDLFVPLRSFITAPVIQILLANKNTKKDTKWLLQRNNIFNLDNSGPGKPNTYEEVIFLAYSFQFRSLKNTLDTWAAEERGIIQKSGWLALFDMSAAGDLLAQAIKNEEFDSAEQKLYALEMLNYVTQPIIYGGGHKIMRLIRAYEKSGIRSFYDNLEYLQKQLAVRASKPKPSGDNRFTLDRSKQFHKHSDTERAVQYMMLLNESGFQMTLRNIYLQSSEDWYLIFKAAFEIYPYPFLFYSLQFTNKDFLKKVGQDYAFSRNEFTVSQLPVICKRLFDNLYDAPGEIGNNILIFLSKLIIAIDPTLWQNDFFIFWQKLMDEEIAFDKEHNDAHPPLIIAAIQIISGNEIILKIVKDCLNEVKLGKEGQPINFLYHLNKNIHFKQLAATKALHDLDDVIDGIIDGLDVANIDHIFAIGNVFEFLSQKQRNKIARKLSNLNLTGVRNPRIWSILVYFSQGNPNLQTAIQDAVTKHADLWYTGIQGNMVQGSFIDEVIKLSRFTYSDFYQTGLVWNQKNILAIFDRLKIALADIIRMGNFRDEIVSFLNTLEEMIDFLDRHGEVLKEEQDYKTIAQLARETYNLHRNFNDLEEGLTSNVKSEVLTALSDLSQAVYANQFDSDHVILILNKILLQSEPGLEASLSYVASWFTDKRHSDRFKNRAPLLLRILKKYSAQPLVDCDASFVEEKLIRLAYLVKRWENEHSVVQEWMEIADQSRYNNVKQYVSKINQNLSGDEE